MKLLIRPDWRVRGIAWLFVLLLLTGFFYVAEAQVHLLAIGDWGADTPAQRAVASAMKSYVVENHIQLDAVLLLGDNFYVDLTGGVKDRRWQKLFEEMYDPKTLSMPFYAVLGNHDY